MKAYTQALRLLNGSKPFKLVASSDLMTINEADKLKRKGLVVKYKYNQKEVVVTNITNR